MFKKSVFVLGLTGCAAFGFGAVAVADVPIVPPASTVGMTLSAAKGVLADGGYSPKVISRNGGGPNCVVFNQVAVTHYDDWATYRTGKGSDDDKYAVYLSVNCTK
ncbi:MULTISPECIES: hypothetical protein [unclassified Rhodococcus (in: high G+C Gram-positive bacteria)]|uniref:hypothetical protein n=1 Tax=unclassified Rhodococcus (in: high G+C Gram-positive bacteria) TaxID=192944 RepID=UPI003399DC00